jgi:mRNA-degrading endonuclease RelE of RelBE toxin-antitoxin system
LFHPKVNQGAESQGALTASTMKVALSDRAIEALKKAVPAVRRAFEKQLRLLENNLQHPSLRAKKYDEFQ